jgi:hypothetical protein
VERISPFPASTNPWQAVEKVCQPNRLQVAQRFTACDNRFVLNGAFGP